MTANIGKGRTLHVCDVCGGVDDHPRHTIAGASLETFPIPTAETVQRVMAASPPDELDRLLTDLLDTGSSDRHMDCCRAAGCPAGVCDAVTAGAEDKRGAALLKHLVGLADIAAGDDAIVKGE